MTVPIRYLAVLPLLAATPGLAELPPPVRAMLEAAAESGDGATFAAVAKIARATNPDDIAEIAAIETAFAAVRDEEEAQRAAAEERALRQADAFDNWSGRGEVGAFRATGNSDNTGFTGSLELTRAGIDWTHKLHARADYQRSNGVTSREQYFASYEPRFQIGERVFAYGLGQFERDTFQGYAGRYALSGGLGLKVVDDDSLQLAVKGGPAFRHTDFVGGENETSLAGLLGVDFDWRIADRLKLTQDANAVAAAGGQAVAVIGGSSTSVTLVTGLDAKVTDRLSTRVSYTVEYDSDPPIGAVNTDTQTRFSVVYGF